MHKASFNKMADERPGGGGGWIRFVCMCIHMKTVIPETYTFCNLGNTLGSYLQLQLHVHNYGHVLQMFPGDSVGFKYVTLLFTCR